VRYEQAAAEARRLNAEAPLPQINQNRPIP
jgi:hypothetical protein